MNAAHTCTAWKPRTCSASLSEPLAEGLRRALLVAVMPPEHTPRGPGVVVFDEHGVVESISQAAEQWIERRQPG